MNRDEFCIEFVNLIEKLDAIDEDLIYLTSNMIRTKIKEIKTDKLIHIGPCFECGKNINYLPLSTAHRSQGDIFLDRFKLKWKEFLENLGDDESSSLENSAETYKKYVKYQKSTVKPYFCETCYDWIEAIWEYLNELEIEKTEKEKLRSENFKHKIDNTIKSQLLDELDVHALRSIGWIRGKFGILKRCYTEFEYNLLVTMRYNDFLKTVYWYIVRKHFLKKYGEQCFICNSTEYLNVHHRTYKNHGREHEHLEDLVVLCKDCHAKFHDKLDSI